MDLQLAKKLNFRDLGGIATMGGSAFRKATVYRSAAPVDLSQAELRAFATLGLSAIVDMRYNSERTARAIAWQDMGVRTYRTQQNEPEGGADFAALLLDETFGRNAAVELMKGVYRRMPFDHLASLRDVFGQLLAGDGPTLVHCTSGKDRTGMASALLLAALGAPREAIIEDYLASLAYDAFANPSFRRIPEHRREALRPIFSVDADFLAAMFGAIEDRSGSIEVFLAEALGVTTFERKRLRELLTQ